MEALRSREGAQRPSFGRFGGANVLISCNRLTVIVLHGRCVTPSDNNEERESLALVALFAGTHSQGLNPAVPVAKKASFRSTP
jgi:hypothetical protein